MNFQKAVYHWVEECFGTKIADDKTERNFRFIEESLELVQSCGMSKEDCLRAIEYTFNRPIGNKEQEVGGVMVTLASLCSANDISMFRAGELELDRVWNNIDKIKEKHKSKMRAE